MGYVGGTVMAAPSRSFWMSLVIGCTVTVVIGFLIWRLVSNRAQAIALADLRVEHQAASSEQNITALIKQVDLLLINLRSHLTQDDLAKDVTTISVDRSADIGTRIKLLMQEVPAASNLQVVGADGRTRFGSTSTASAISLVDSRIFESQRTATTDVLRISAPLTNNVNTPQAMVLSRRLVDEQG